MLGEALDCRGGIVTVEQTILGTASAELSFHHIATLPNGSSLRKMQVFVRALFALCWQLAVGGFNVVHIHVSIGGSVYRQTLTASIAQAFRKPVIMHAHAGEFPEFYLRQPGLVRCVVRWVFRRCDCLIALTQRWRQLYVDLLGIDPDKIVVLPSAIHLPSNLPQRSASPITQLVYLGRICHAKGAFDLIHAVAELPSDLRSSIHVTLAGDGEPDQARRLGERLGLGACMTVLDWVDTKRRDALLAEADVFLLPSYFEGLPLALLEAMSWGLPAIATPVGGIPDVIEHGRNGLLVKAGDVRALSQAMRRLIQQPSERVRLGCAARASVEGYAAPHYAVRLVQVYRTLSERGGLPAASISRCAEPREK